MSTEEPLDFTAIEAALAALVPTTGGLDRDRLMYQAGRASAIEAGEARQGASLDSYAALRKDLLRDGPAAWPEPPRQVPAGKTSQPATYRQMLDKLLEDSGRPKPTHGRPAGKTLIPSGVHS